MKIPLKNYRDLEIVKIKHSTTKEELYVVKVKKFGFFKDKTVFLRYSSDITFLYLEDYFVTKLSHAFRFTNMDSARVSLDFISNMIEKSFTARLDYYVYKQGKWEEVTDISNKENEK